MTLHTAIIENLSELKREKPSLFSEVETVVSEDNYQLMSKASVELIDFISEDATKASMLEGKPTVAQNNMGNLSSMIGVDFHITEDGPKIIEINTNAGGLVTSALWAYKNNQKKLECVLQEMLKMFELEYTLWNKHNQIKSFLEHIVIVDENPEEEFTYDDFILMSLVFKKAGYKVSIAKTEDLTVKGDRVYISSSSQAVDMIYNRDCDFYMQSSATSVLREAYLNALVCVSPNAHGYGLLSDKANLAKIYILLQEEQSSNYMALQQVVLPTTTLSSFISEGWNKNGWYFKPVNEHAGKGVFRGQKISVKKFNELQVKDYIAQKEAKPGLIKFNDRDFKYDLRLYIYRGAIIDITSRVYQGRITNFRTENGGYSEVRLAKAAPSNSG